MDHAFVTVQNLPPHMQRYKFWIWLQIVILTFHIRHILCDTRQMMLCILPSGKVYIEAVGDEAGAVQADPFAFTPSPAFLRALSGPAPAWAGICPPRMHPEPGIEFHVPSIPDSGAGRNEQTPVSLPLPET